MIHCCNYNCKAKKECLRYDKKPNIQLYDYIQEDKKEILTCSMFLELEETNAK